MTSENECKVFHTLRVSEDSDDLAEDDEVKTHVLYNGISANSWLTPIGISVKKTAPNKHIGYLNEECRKTISEQAKGNNGIVGRRHFELTKQLLTDQDLVVGKHFSSKHGCGRSNFLEENIEKDRDSEFKGFANRRPSLAVGRPVTRVEQRRARTAIQSKLDTLRPFTAPSILARDINEDNSETFPTLFIRQCTALTSQENTTLETTGEQLKPKRSRNGGTKSAPPHSSSHTSTTGFNSLHAMQEAYELKLKQPLPAWVSNDGRSAGGQIPYPKDMVESCDTKAISPRNRFDKDATIREMPQSSLKPLMYNKDSDVRHSAGCPYKCKGCFKACLASDDFIQDKSKTNTKPNNKVAERRAILRQNKPAWKNEQKQPTSNNSRPKPVSNSRNRSILRIIRKEVPLSAYAWSAGPSYPPFTKYDTLITQQVRNGSVGSHTNNMSSSDEINGLKSKEDDLQEQ